MPGLGETTARLHARRADLRRGSQAHPLRETVEFGANPGELRMFSYEPPGLAPGAPLVVVLHGCTQNAGGFAANGGWLKMADLCGFAVLAPQQTPSNNANLCFNWFQPHDARRGEGEAASIAAMVAHLLVREKLDADQVFVMGLSAGGAMTAILLASYPELFAGGAVIAGLPYGLAKTLPEAMGLMRQGGGRSLEDLGGLVRKAAPRSGRRPRVSVWHGEADFIVAPANGVDVARQWASAYGLSETPDETLNLRGCTRSIWRTRTGESLVELNLLSQVGHGLPLASEEDGLGSASPFMLEVGVSSTREIAAFFGLAETDPQDLGQGRGAHPKAGLARRRRGPLRI